jgi:sulfite exporter TauE/SafE
VSAAVVTLLFVVLGLLIVFVALACSAWSMAATALEKIERLERGVTVVVKHQEREADDEADAWWRARGREA